MDLYLNNTLCTVFLNGIEYTINLFAPNSIPENAPITLDGRILADINGVYIVPKKEV